MASKTKPRKNKAGSNVQAFKSTKGKRSSIYEHDWEGNNANKQTREEHMYDTSRMLASTYQVLGSSTSRVIGKTFDFLIMSALTHIHTGSTMMVRGLSEMMVLISSNQRRVFSNSKTKSTKRETLDAIFTFIMSSECASSTREEEELEISEQCYVALASINLDKAYYRQIISAYLDLHQKYATYQDEILEDYSMRQLNTSKMRMIEAYTGAYPDSLYGRGVMVRHFFGLYEEFLDNVCAKYYKLAFSEAVKMTKIHTEARIDKDDLFKKLVVAIIRALDRYSYSKGTFTSFLKFFFQDAKVKNIFDYDSNQIFRVASISSAQAKKAIETTPTLYAPYDEDVANSIEDTSSEATPLSRLLARDSAESTMRVVRHIKGMDMAKIFLGVSPILEKPT